MRSAVTSAVLLGLLIILTGCSILVELKLQFLPEAILITDAIPETRVLERGETFLTDSFSLSYQAGSLWISSTLDGTGKVLVDDALDIMVTRPDGEKLSKTYDFSAGCTIDLSKPGVAVSPIDVTSLFRPGDNEVHIRLYDICGGVILSTALYLVNK